MYVCIIYSYNALLAFYLVPPLARLNKQQKQ